MTDTIATLKQQLLELKASLGLVECG